MSLIGPPSQSQETQQLQIVVMPSSDRTRPNSPLPSSASHASLVGGSGASSMIGTTLAGSNSSSTQNASLASLKGITKLEPAEPIPASKVKRNDRKRIIPDLTPNGVNIKPIETGFNRPQKYDSWEPHVHPDGALYFFDPKRRIYTDADLSVEKERLIINHHADEVLEQGRQIHEFPLTTYELVLERTKGSGCGYYFVEPNERCIFWLKDVSSNMVAKKLERVQSLAHIKYVMEAEYWTHCMHFPNKSSVTAKVVAELKKMVLHATADSVASSLSVIPFDKEELAKILDLIEGMKSEIEELYPHASCIIARFMQDFALAKFFNFCGQPGARLNSDQLIFRKSNPRRSMFIELVSFCLFGAPCDYAKELDGIWVDKVINRVLWKQFIAKLADDWSSLALSATVILNANVAFLALSENTAARAFSFVSTMTSVGVVVIGLVLVRQNQRKDQDSAEHAGKFLGNVLNEVFGLEWLAIIYSLPYALLMWSMVWFIIAFACMVLWSDPARLVTKCTFGLAGGFICLFVLGTVWTTRATSTAS